MTLTNKRAFTDEAKQARRDTILEAAAQLFAAGRYDEVTMVSIARRAGVAKGTVYLYFPTKEALFLEHARDHIAAFFASLRSALASLPDDAGGDAFTGALGAAIDAHPTMVRLLSLLHGVLESNVDQDAALAFRASLLPELEQAGAEAERVLPHLAPRTGARLLLTIHAMGLGFKQVADPAPAIAALQDRTEMRLFAVDFRGALLGTVRLLLDGLAWRAAQGAADVHETVKTPTHLQNEKNRDAR